MVVLCYINSLGERSMNINLHHLELFYYVAEAGGISAAVKVIPYPIQQPAISQQVLTLEKSLGVKLFERRPFNLTEAGRVMINCVRPFMEQLATLEDDLKGLHRVRFRIGCPALIADYYVPELLPRLAEKHPELLPQVFELEGREPYKNLVSREVDLVISSEPLPRSKALTSINMISLPYTLVVPKDHELAKNFAWDYDHLQDVRWISLQESSGGMILLNQEINKLGLTPSYGAATNSITTAMKYVKIGLGIGFMICPPKFLLNELGLVAISLNNLPTADVNISYIGTDDNAHIIESFVEEALALVKGIKKDFLAHAGT